LFAAVDNRYYDEEPGECDDVRNAAASAANGKEKSPKRDDAPAHAHDGDKQKRVAKRKKKK
jgi:hypothetical protein